MSPSTETEPVARRTVLRGAVSAATAGLAVSAAPSVAAQAAGEPDYGGWFEKTSNYDGTVDKTGQESVTIAVGADGNNGNFAFSPAAVRVDPGTEIVWEWTGNGSLHNVVAEDGRFESELTDEAGFTFEQTLDSTGVYKYACAPHKQMGMKGAVVVGDPATGGLSDARLRELLTIGSGLGLTGVLVTTFALGTHSQTRNHRE